MRKEFYSALFILLLTCLCDTARALPYKYVREVTILESQIPDGASLNNFPVLFKFTHPDFRLLANGGHVENINGYDIVFYRNSCSDILDQELEYYNPVTGEVVVWLRIPVLSTTSNMRIYMYYGNSSVTTPVWRTTTWDPSYSAVWHMNTDPSIAAPQVPDASPNGRSGTAYGGMTSANLVAGKMGNSISFDEVNDYIRIPDFLYGQELTVSFWFNMADATGTSYQYLFSHGGWALQNSLNVYMGEDAISIPAEVPNRNMLKTVFRDNNDANNYDILDAGNTFVGGWHYYTVRIQDFGGATVYLDGTQVAVYTVWGANVFNPTTDIFLGGREDLNPGRFYGGLLDEVRISTVWRSSNWIRTEYNNQNNPTAFMSLGIEGTALGYCYPLAIKLKDFIAERSVIGAQLKWKTENAIEANHVIVERSQDGINWQSIGNISNTGSFIDSFAPPQETYYRIRIQQGVQEDVSDIKKITAASFETSSKVYPNPSANGQFFIQFADAAIPEQIILYDAAGAFVEQVIAEKKTDNLYILKMVKASKKGVYLLRLQYRDRVETTKVLIL